MIGLGGVARLAHLPGFAHPLAAPRLEIVASVDPAPSATPVEGIPLLRDTGELATLGPIDFVDICTPTSSHLPLTLWALEQGYHVLCEKPVALSAAEAVRIRDAARAAGRIVMPCHQYRFNPAWLALKQALDDGAIGRWHLAEFYVYRLAADVGAARSAEPWRGQAADARGGVLLDHGTHLIYELLDVAGPPVALRSWLGRLLHQDYTVEDSAQLLFEYPGRVGVMLLTWAARRRDNVIRFVGDRGMIEWVGGQLVLERDGQVETRDFSAQLDKASYAGWFAALFSAFAAAIDRGDGARHLADIADVAAVLEAAYRTPAPSAAG